MLWVLSKLFNYSCILQEDSALKSQFTLQSGLRGASAVWIAGAAAPWHTKLKLQEALQMWALTFMVFAYRADFKVLQMSLPFQFNSLMLARCSRKLWANYFSPSLAGLRLTCRKKKQECFCSGWLRREIKSNFEGKLCLFLPYQNSKETDAIGVVKELSYAAEFCLALQWLFLLQDKIMWALWIYRSLLTCHLLLYWV